MIKYDKQNRKLEKLKREKSEALAAARKAEEERNRVYDILDGIMHETRRLNSEIANACEEISKYINKGQYDSASQEADGAFYTSGVLSSRLTFADFELNPEAVVRQARYSAGVYKKFDKTRRILLRSAYTRRINIRLEGPSHNEIDVLPAFEMVPFVLVDNAVKYSPDEQEIFISVADDPSPGCRVEVNVSSIGPTVEPSEIPHLFERGFQGENAARSKSSGQGIGLYLAKTLVDLVNGSLDVSSETPSRYYIDGIGYSRFSVTLRV